MTVRHTRPVKAESDSTTRATELKNRIGDAIVSGQLLPGVRLDEQTLADEFGTSRTPVREALRQLAAIRLVEMRPRRGAVVATVDDDDLLNMFETMAEMEAACARYAAMRMTVRERQKLRDRHEGAVRLVQANDHRGYTEHNLVLHNLIYAGTHNPHMAETMADIRTRLTPFRTAQFRQPERLERSQAEHGLVVEAILAADPDQAMTAMRAHITTVRETAAAYMANQQAQRPIRFNRKRRTPKKQAFTA